MKQVHRRLLSLAITLVAFLAFAGWVGQEQEELKVEVETESKDAKIFFCFLSPFDVDGIVMENSHGRFELIRERDRAEDIGRWRLNALWSSMQISSWLRAFLHRHSRYVDA